MSKRILIVDDDTVITSFMRKRLENEGYECEECWDGSAALKKISTSDYDLFIIDYSMPGMKGDELCQTIREQDKTKALPIVIMTAFHNKEASMFIEHVATDVIYKPIDDEKLLPLVEQLLKN